MLALIIAVFMMPPACSGMDVDKNTTSTSDKLPAVTVGRVNTNAQKPLLGRARVVAQDGKPVSRAVVFFNDKQVRTYATGFFNMMLQPEMANADGTFVITSDDGKLGSYRCLQVSDLVKGDMVITLQPLLTLRIAVKDESGNPVKGASVRMDAVGSHPMDLMNPIQSTTDVSGVGIFQNLYPGATYELTSTQWGYYRPDALLVKDVGGAGWTGSVDLVVKKTNRVQHGKVIDKDGNPVPGVQVRWKKWTSTRTDVNGEFILEGLPDDPVRLNARLDGTKENLEGSAEVSKDCKYVVITIKRSPVEELLGNQ